MKNIFTNTAIKYLLVGILNTIVGFGAIIIFMFIGILPEIANLLGYFIGIIFSYFLNKHFTFQSQNSHKKDFIRFAASMGAAYLINLAVFILAFRIFLIDKYISQIIASIFYTISGYVLSKYWAFK